MSVATAKVAGRWTRHRVARRRATRPAFSGNALRSDAAGADEIYCIGGVQAMASWPTAALACARPTLSPGLATRLSPRRSGSFTATAGIDLLAGPTEILVIADEGADPDLVAIDLLGQAEHGPDSPAWLITTSEASVAR